MPSHDVWCDLGPDDSGFCHWLSVCGPLDFILREHLCQRPRTINLASQIARGVIVEFPPLPDRCPVFNSSMLMPLLRLGRTRKGLVISVLVVFAGAQLETETRALAAGFERKLMRQKHRLRRAGAGRLGVRNMSRTGRERSTGAPAYARRPPVALQADFGSSTGA
jgi:hypothetical protein